MASTHTERRLSLFFPQRQRVAELVKRGEAEGAVIHTAHRDMLDGQGSATEGGDGVGSYFPPTLVTGVGSASCLVQEEIFGPVVVVQVRRRKKGYINLYIRSSDLWS